MNAMNARQQLIERGFLILFKAVADEFINNIRSAARHDGLTWSIGTWNGAAIDALCLHALLPSSLCRVLEELFRHQYMTFFPHTSGTAWSLVCTMVGALDSPVRRDFLPPLADAHAADLSALPGVLLVATQDDTIIYGYGWNRLVALCSNVETIRLNKGDMVMLRGDFIYSTAGYQTNNLLIHGYLETPYYLRDLEGSESQLVAVIDDISVVDDNPFCYVYKCPFVASGSTSLRKHFNRYNAFFFGRPRQ